MNRNGPVYTLIFTIVVCAICSVFVAGAYEILGERQRAQVEAYVRQHDVHHQNQHVNRWLERTYAFEEGPPKDNVATEGLLTALREDGPVYP